MNIFNKVALQGLKKSRTRTIVTIIGVILSSALIMAVVTFGVSLLNYMVRGSIMKAGDWHVAFTDADSSFIEDQVNNKEVEDAFTFENIGYAALDSCKNENKPYVFIAGFNEETFNNLPINLLSGRMPENSNEIIVSGKIATDGGVKMAMGDTVTLTVGNRIRGTRNLTQQDLYNGDSEFFVPQGEKTFKVVGICQRPQFEDNSAPGYTVITKTAAGEKADSSTLFVKLKNPYHLKSYTKYMKNNSYMKNDYVLRFMGLSEDKVFNSLIYITGGIVVAIIMIGSVFLIYNSFNISLNERTQQFGILMSVGATARQLRNSVLFEGLCIGAMGIPVGILTGLGCSALVISLVGKYFGNILYTNVPLTLTISLPAMACAAVVSLITILLSAYIPARKAVKTPVMDCLRQTNEVKLNARTVKTSNLGSRIYGLEGTLALKNFKRNKKRYRSIVLSLSLSVILFISASAFVEEIKDISGGSKEVTTFDIGFDAGDMEDSEMINLYDTMKTAEGVYESSYQTLVKTSVNIKASDLTEDYWQYAEAPAEGDTAKVPVAFQFLDDEAYNKIAESVGMSPDKILAVAKIETKDAVLDMFKETSLELNPGFKENVQVNFVDTVPPDSVPVLDNTMPSSICFDVMVPYSMKDKLLSKETPVAVKGMTFNSKTPSKSVKQMETIIEGAGVTADYRMYNFNKMMDENRNNIFIVNVFAYTFITMISLIAVANVFNTISTNIKLRRKELAMLRSVGMSEHDFQKMMNFECIFYGIRALALGLPLSVLFSWIIYKVMFISEDYGVHFILPWKSIIISIVSVMVVVFVTMLYAISKIKKENIIDALRDDMA